MSAPPSGSSIASENHLADPNSPSVNLIFCSRLQRRLLRWFSRHRRDLPWRRSRDPYRIWVSEVMLQQTHVATVLRYFEPFIRAYPTVMALAAADEQDVLRQWEGLGYYRRVRNMHRMAKLVAENHGGQFPNSPTDLQNFPGIGKYTMGAILSQAFDQRQPILETNSRRVLCRLFGRTGDPTRAPAVRWLWKMAEALLPARRVGEFNQSLMELGSLVCTPVNPRCSACPVAADCKARRLGLQRQIPTPTAKPSVTKVEEIAVIIRRGENVLLLRRPEDGRWPGLWEFPHGPTRDDESRVESAVRLALELTGLSVEPGRELATLRHTITRYRITLTCLEARRRAGRFRSKFYREAAWVRPDQLKEFPVSSPQRRLAFLLFS